MGRMRFECKALLKLKIPEKDNIMGLSWEKYELLTCDYRFYKNIDRDGEVSSDLRGGLVTMSIIGEPSDELLAWMFDHVKKYNGEVTVMDASEETLEQVYFEDARLVYLFIHYRAEDKPNTVTELKMSANNMRIGNAYFENLNV
jgi:hypothetical protein